MDNDKIAWLRDKLQSWPGEMCLVSEDIANLIAILDDYEAALPLLEAARRADLIRHPLKNPTLIGGPREDIITTSESVSDILRAVLSYKEKTTEQDEPGGQGETKRKEEKMSDQEAAINIARDAYCGERPEDEHEDR